VNQVSDGGAAVHDRGPGERHHGHLPHPGEVEHQSAVTERAARPVVPTGLHRERKPVFDRDPDRGLDVRRVRAASDDRRSVWDGGVPDLAGRLVAVLRDREDGAGHQLAEPL